VLWAELWLLGGLPKTQLKAAAKAVSSSSTTTNNNSVRSSAAARPDWMLLRRRQDAAVLLLQWGLARLSAAEDFEWLGVRPTAARAYAR
jgi:hypothetical protein